MLPASSFPSLHMPLCTSKVPRIIRRISVFSFVCSSFFDRRRRRSSASTPSVANVPASQFAPRRASWDYLGTSAVQNASREVEPRNNANFRQRRREGASTFWQHAPEPEGQRWAPPPLSGLYGTHGILDSELPAQVGRHVPQAFHRYPSVEDIDVQPSTSFYHPR